MRLPPTKDSTRLSERIKWLDARCRTEDKTATDIEALAEAHFRFALCPDTTPAETVRRLRRAIRLDSTNPKFPYHLARVLLSHGKLSVASKWIRRAADLCPTSHRIWTHVCLLQLELNFQYYGDRKYEPDDLRRRASRIFEAVRNGEDAIDRELLTFKPPESRAYREERMHRTDHHAPEESRAAVSAETVAEVPNDAGLKDSAKLLRTTVNRMLDPRRCRWSGLYELEIESHLEAEANQASAHKMLPLLQQVAALATASPRRAASFAILAVQWLVCGYPVRTIRELCPPDPDGASNPAAELLDLVCRIREAKDSDVLAMLAQAARTEMLPPYLIAALHRRYVLGRSLEFKLYSSYRRMQRQLRALSQIPAGTAMPDALKREAGASVKRVEHAIESLNVSSFKTLDSDDIFAVTEALSPEEACRQLKRLTDTAERLKTQSDRLFESAKADSSWTGAQLRTAHDIIPLLTRKAGEGLSELDKIQEGLRALELLECRAEISTQIQQCQRVFREVAMTGRLSKALRRIEKDLNLTPPLGEGDDELERLESRARDITQRIHGRLAAAQEALTIYPQDVQVAPPIRRLRALIEQQAAEAQYRLGHLDVARRLWLEILRTDATHVSILRNLAVSDSCSMDTGRSSASWSRYAEALYYLDVVAGDPVLHAKERVDLHRQIARAYGSTFLNSKRDPRWIDSIDERDVIAGFTNVARIRAYANHRLLEAFNAKLLFRSPVLSLGVGRTESADQFDAANQQLHAFAEACRSMFPPRTRDSFVKLCQDHFDRARDSCRKVDSLTLQADPGYDGEKDRQKEWLGDVLDLRYRLSVIGSVCKTLVGSSALIGLIELAFRLEEIPLGLSRTLLDEVARTFAPQNPDQFVANLNRTRESLVVNLAAYLFREDHDAADRKQRDVQYLRLINRWIRNPALEKYLPFLDDPVQFYSEDISFCVQNGARFASMSDTERKKFEHGMSELQRWCDHWPHITGPARRLGPLLAMAKKPTAAVAVLKNAEQNGFYSEGVAECRSFRKRIQ